MQDVVEHLEAVGPATWGLTPRAAVSPMKASPVLRTYSVGVVIGPRFAGGRTARYQLSAAVSAPGSEKRSRYRPVAFNQRAYSPGVVPST